MTESPTCLGAASWVMSPMAPPALTLYRALLGLHLPQPLSSPGVPARKEHLECAKNGIVLIRNIVSSLLSQQSASSGFVVHEA